MAANAYVILSDIEQSLRGAVQALEYTPGLGQLTFEDWERLHNTLLEAHQAVREVLGKLKAVRTPAEDLQPGEIYR